MTQTDYIDRIEAIDRQLQTVTKMRQAGDLLAAGLSIGLTVGAKQPDDDYKVDLGLGLTSDVEGLLDIVIDGLKESRKFNLDQMRRQHARMSTFLDKEGK